jgi:hypothetical protein
VDGSYRQASGRDRFTFGAKVPLNIKLGSKAGRDVLEKEKYLASAGYRKAISYSYGPYRNQ